MRKGLIKRVHALEKEIAALKEIIDEQQNRFPIFTNEMMKSAFQHHGEISILGISDVILEQLCDSISLPRDPSKIN